MVEKPEAYADDTFEENEEEDANFAHSKEIKEIVIYIFFMFFFTLSTCQGIMDNDIYYFGRNLKDQLVGVEMQQKHSPVFAKTFEDIATVEEFYHWMQGALIHTVYSPATFDNDAGWSFQNGSSRIGYTLGHGKFLGPIRISQLRSKAFNCDDHIYKTLTANYSFRCFGSQDYFSYGQFTEGTELTIPFANFSLMHNSSAGDDDGAQPFLYDGITVENDGYGGLKGTPITSPTVKEYRAAYNSWFETKNWNIYPSPAYSIVLPTDLGYDNAEVLMKNLADSHYIDLHTRAIFVDITVYNPMVDRLCYCRLVGEITSAGGVMPDFEFKVVPLWEMVGRTEDYILIGIRGIVGLFYFYYFCELLPRLFPRYRLNWSFFSSFLNCAQVANVVFFLAQNFLIYYSDTLFPDTFDVNGPTFIEMLPSVQFKSQANMIAGINVFLNWFKFISILSYDPNFGLINNTLARSASGVMGFLVVFFIIFIGFAQAHCLIFVGRLENFRTISESLFSLLRSLLGDFDFAELQMGHFVMGPLLFICFVSMAVFVVLNMLIAIISDAYETCREEMKDYPPVDLVAEIKDFVLRAMLRGCCQQLVKACCRSWYDRIGPEGATVHPEGEGGGGAGDGVGGPKEDSSANAIEESMQMAMAKMKSNSPSDLILIEWFDSLKQNEEDMSNLQKEMSMMKHEVGAVKKHFDGGMAQVSIAADSINKLVATLRARAVEEVDKTK